MVLFLYFIGSFAFFTCKKDTNNILNQHTTKTYLIFPPNDNLISFAPHGLPLQIMLLTASSN